MRERLIDLLNKTIAVKDENTDDYIEWLVDELLANGVIVPILNTGDIVYRVSKNRMWEVKIWKVEIFGGTISYIDNYDKSFLENNIGLGVFLSREEAEKALEKRR